MPVESKECSTDEVWGYPNPVTFDTGCLTHVPHLRHWARGSPHMLPQLGFTHHFTPTAVSHPFQTLHIRVRGLPYFLLHSRHRPFHSLS